MGLIENTLTGNLILTVMLAFAEYERGTIVERTQTGKMIARQNPNFKDGRPKKYTPIQIEHALSLLSSGMSYKEVEEITGISKSTMIREKKKQSVYVLIIAQTPNKSHQTKKADNRKATRSLSFF